MARLVLNRFAFGGVARIVGLLCPGEPLRPNELLLEYTAGIAKLARLEDAS